MKKSLISLNLIFIAVINSSDQPSTSSAATEAVNKSDQGLQSSTPIWCYMCRSHIEGNSKRCMVERCEFDGCDNHYYNVTVHKKCYKERCLRIPQCFKKLQKRFCANHKKQQ